MDGADLQVFETVARLGGIGRAAQALNTVQSNVTTRIQLLEQELGTTLFERHARGVTLTAAGRRLLPYASEVKDLLLRARRAAVDDGTPKGPLTIGTLETTIAIRLPHIIGGYMAAYPDVDLTLRTGTSAESLAHVLDRELDGAFVAGPVEHPELVHETMFREELVILTPSSVRTLHELTQMHPLKLLVLRVGCSYRQRLESVLAARGIVDARPLEFGSLDAIIGCVAAGIGISLLPRSLLEGNARHCEVAMHVLPPHEAIAETLFVRRRDGYTGSALVQFMEHARDGAVDVLRAAAE